MRRPISYYNKLFELVDEDINKYFTKNENLTFLVGAGISVEPPSCVASARKMMDAILHYGAAPDSINKISEIKSLRYEYLIQLFQEMYDPQLQIMEYYEEIQNTNIIHKFLARMIEKKKIVITTNFDNLIENEIGKEREDFNIVITYEDFKKYEDPIENLKNGLLLYKIHGSLKNTITGETTRNSLVNTIKSLGKDKDGDIFLLENHKRKFLEQACKNRILIVMGYSGGDDFDIIPTILKIKGIERIIWISHINNIENGIKTYKLRDVSKIILQNSEHVKKEDKTLYLIKKYSNVEILKVNCHTGLLISQLMGIPYKKNAPDLLKEPFMWLLKKMKIPRKSYADYFTGKIFFNYGLYDEAMKYIRRTYEDFKNLDNLSLMAMVYFSMGIIHYNSSEFDKALECYQKSLKFYTEVGDERQIAEGLRFIGIIYTSTGKRDLALEKFRKSLEISMKNGYKALITQNFVQIGHIYRETGEPEKALNIFQDAYDKSKKNGDLINMSNQLSNLSLLLLNLGEYDRAFQYLQDAYEIDEKLGNINGMAADLGNLGNVQRNLGKLQEALNSFQKAYELYESMGGFSGMAVMLGNISLIHFDFGNLELALENNYKALEIKERIGDLMGKAGLLCNMGLIYNDLGQPNRALDLFREAYNIDESLKNIQGMASDLGNIGLSYMDLGDTETALEHFKKSYELNEKLGNLREIANQLCNLGRYQSTKKNLKEAIQYYKKSYEIFKKIKDPIGMAEQVNNIGVMFLYGGLKEHALTCFQDAYVIFDKKGLTDRTTQLSHLIEQLKTELKKNFKKDMSN